jgi:hypothetical protein
MRRLTALARNSANRTSPRVIDDRGMGIVLPATASAGPLKPKSFAFFAITPDDSSSSFISLSSRFPLDTPIVVI